MTEADEMFEELGWHKVKTSWCEEAIAMYSHLEEDDDGIASCITFYKNKEIQCFCSDNTYSPTIDMQTLKAINKKCEELGWL